MNDSAVILFALWAAALAGSVVSAMRVSPWLWILVLLVLAPAAWVVYLVMKGKG